MHTNQDPFAAVAHLGETPPPRPFEEGRQDDAQGRHYDPRLDAYVSQAVEQPPQAKAARPEEPLPLRKAPQAQEAYPVEALGVFAKAVTAIAEHVGVPLSMTANSVLAALSLCSQGHANVEHEGRVTPLSLFLASIGASGDRKSSVDAIVLAPVRKHEDALRVTHKENMRLWCIDSHAYETAKKNISKGKDFAVIKEALTALGDPPQKPISPYIVASNVNIEGLYKLFQDGRASLGLISDEGGIFLGGTAIAHENKLKTISNMSSLWSTGGVDKVRMGEGASRIQHKRLVVHLMVQPAVIKPLFSDSLMQEQGFWPRFLIVWPKSLKGTRLKGENPPQNIYEHKAIKRLFAQCTALLQLNADVDDKGNTVFRTLSLSSEAESVYRALYNRTEKEQSEDGALAHVSNYASRCAEQSLRLAGVLALASNPDARDIDGDTMRRAAILALWYLHEAKRIMEDSAVSADIVRAEKLLKWLQGKAEKIVSQRDMTQYGPLRSGKEVKEALHVLQEHGYVHKAANGTVLSGSVCRTAWEVL